MTARRLYFDNAATSFPKPPRVMEAMAEFARDCGAPGRGLYAEAQEAARLIRRCRERINRLINGENPDHVVFGYNTTDALNLAIKGVVAHRRRTNPGKPIHLVTTHMDHNSVLRPFNHLLDEANGDIEVTRVPASAETGLVAPAAICSALRPDTALVAINHVSNVTGTIQPAASIGVVCRERGALFLLDAAQSLGHIEVDVQAMNVDLLAFPGHKGLLGPTGTGGLYIRPGVEHSLDSIREGGTGSRSEVDRQPQDLPDKYEPGSHNTLGIVGLSEGVAWLLERGAVHLREHEQALTRLMLKALLDPEKLPGVSLLGPKDAAARVGVFSIVHERLNSLELSGLLERDFGILTRAGLHCAPLAHKAITASKGATRFSLGPFHTLAEVEYAIKSLSTICTGVRVGAK